MKIDKSTLKRLIKEAIKDIQEASENPFDTPEMKALAKASRDAKTAAKQRAEFDRIRKTGKMAPSKPGASAKKPNPAATKFDVMNKLNKKVGNMAMKVIVGALEKDPKLMTTLSMVLKEETRTLAEQTDPRAALIGAVDAALSEIDMDPDLRMKIGKTLGDSVADKFFFGFEAKQKD